MTASVYRSSNMPMEIPRLRYSKNEIIKMSESYFTELIKKYWNELKPIMDQEEFIAFSHALSIRILKHHNLMEDVSSTVIKEKIRKVIEDYETKHQKMRQAHRNVCSD